ncbi:3'(2'),5'-bisphosphate nucleotidase CysQ family protein [Echinimonas agarilytica]|uniref:Inositol-1-monophosphatase n=1 Tax=Echinimonas agarilytica TaxID=1215918 RepID=A0AA41W9K9_9GAMM|nr:inositol-1-monophosphatase [Echinimonas agarilytica]
MLNTTQIQQLLSVATTAALRAGEYIQNVDRSLVDVKTKQAGSSDASQIVTQVDVDCEALIYQILKPTLKHFQIAFLGEESAASQAVGDHPRLVLPYFWCVDPLDGTLPFTQNMAGYAVSIALVGQDGQPIFGVIYDPVTHTIYQGVNHSATSFGASVVTRQQRIWTPNLQSDSSVKQQVLTLFVDRSFRSQQGFSQAVKLLKQRACQMGYSDIKIHHKAGAVMNAVGVLEHAPACYFKLPKQALGGGSLWDFAATSALGTAAGAWVSDMFGNPLPLNQPDSVFMNRCGVLFASDTDIAEQVLALFGELDTSFKFQCT